MKLSQLQSLDLGQTNSQSHAQGKLRCSAACISLVRFDLVFEEGGAFDSFTFKGPRRFVLKCSQLASTLSKYEGVNGVPLISVISKILVKKSVISKI